MEKEEREWRRRKRKRKGEVMIGRKREKGKRGWEGNREGGKIK